VTLEVGELGQFELFLDGEHVAGRNQGFLTRLLGGGWPDPDDVVEALRERLPRAS